MSGRAAERGASTHRGGGSKTTNEQLVVGGQYSTKGGPPGVEHTKLYMRGGERDY